MATREWKTSVLSPGSAARSTYRLTNGHRRETYIAKEFLCVPVICNQIDSGRTIRDAIC